MKAPFTAYIEELIRIESSHILRDPLLYFANAASLLVLSALVFIVVNFALKKIERQGSALAMFRNRLKAPAGLGVAVAALYAPLEILDVSAKAGAVFDKAFTLAIIVLVTWAAIASIRVAKNIALSHYRTDHIEDIKSRKIYTQIRIIERIVIFCILIIAVALSLMIFESARRIGVSLIASAGVAGVIIGLAAQKVIGAMIAGFQIAVTQPIRIEDVVIVENEWGSVEEINLTQVVVRIWDKRRLVLPTTYFIETPFENWTKNSTDILGYIYLYMDYSVPIDAVREELEKFLVECEEWDGETQNVQVTNATEKTVELRVLFSAKDPSTAWSLKTKARERLIKFLREKYPGSLPRTRIEMPK